MNLKIMVQVGNDPLIPTASVEISNGSGKLTAASTGSTGLEALYSAFERVNGRPLTGWERILLRDEVRRLTLGEIDFRPQDP